METKLDITKDYYQITIPVSEVYKNKNIRRFIDFLRIRKIASQSEATNDEISELAEEANSNFWENNKDNLLNENRT